MAWRFPLAARLTLTLTGVAMLTLAAAAVMQDRALSRGLRAAAEERLVSSARATERLASDHLRGRLGRYAAIYRMPERTGLELGDAATRSSLARSIARQFGATQVELAGADGTLLAQSGSSKRGGSLAAAWQSLRKDPKREAACVGLDESKSAFVPCGSGREVRPEATLRLRDGAAQVLARLPISTGGESGTLLIGAPLDSAVLDAWSETTGSRVSAADPGTASEDPLAEVAHEFPGVELRVSSSLAAELATLAATRRHGSLAGLVALLVALYISSWSARDFLRPIQRIQWATEQVGRGDLEVRLR